MNNLQNLQQLQDKLTLFGQKLSPELCKEFREILDLFGRAHYEFGEQYKMALINLLPQTAQSAATTQPTPQITVAACGTFKPQTQKALLDLAMTLGKNLEMKLKEGKE